MNRRQVMINTAVILLVCLVGATPVTASWETRNRILQEGIEANFAGEYDQAAEIFSRIGKEDPDHPSRAFYLAVVLFWRSSMDPGDSRYVDRIRAYLNQAKAQAEKLLDMDPDDLDALHYTGLIYTYLGRLEAHSGRLYQGGVLGEKGRRYLERALAVCRQDNALPDGTAADCCRSCEDLYFPYGAYSYFAGRLPRFLKWISFLWFIPSGSTEEGLAAIQRAYENSALHRLGAKSLLVGIYLNFEEGRLELAHDLSRGLIERFPDNPYLEYQHARLLIAEGRYRDALRQSESILHKVEGGLRNYDVLVRQGALLVRAEAAIHLENRSMADQSLKKLENNPAFQKNSLWPYTDLLRGMVADWENNRKTAVAYYEKAQSYEGGMKNRIVSRRAGAYLKNPFVISGAVPSVR